jgi:hypothetical protein
MPTLAELLAQCQDDTHRICGAGAAKRLGAWRKLQQIDAELISFIQRALRQSNGRGNGYRLHCARRLSLEAIVLNQLPELFTEDDRCIARETLGIDI